MAVESSDAHDSDIVFSADCVNSQITRDDTDTYIATHELKDGSDVATIHREFRSLDSELEINITWSVNGNTLRTDSEIECLTDCVGDTAKANTLLGFVCYEHYRTPIQEQFVDFI